MSGASPYRLPSRPAGVPALIGAVLALGAMSARAGDPGSWQQVTLPSPSPLARLGHTLSEFQGTAYLYGGWTPSPNGPVALTDIWSWSSTRAAFSRVNSITPSPPHRSEHAAAGQGAFLYVFFGTGADGALLPDVWVYDRPKVCWRPRGDAPAQGPAARRLHSAVNIGGDRILVFGGCGPGGSLLDDLWSYDTFARTWEARAPIPGGGRCGHSAVLLGGQMYVVGGTTVNGPAAEVWRYHPGDDAWTLLPAEGGVPAGFTGAATGAADFTGDGSPEILVAGGQDASGLELDAVHEVSIIAGTARWRPLGPHPPPGGAAAAPVPSAGGNGSALLFFGGARSETPVDETWLFSAPDGVPAAPSDLAAEVPPPPDGSTRVRLTWRDNSGIETGFVIQRAADAAFATDLQELPPLPEGTVEFTDTGLAPNTIYHYRVRAAGAVADSGYSAPARATTLPPLGGRLRAPGRLGFGKVRVGMSRDRTLSLRNASAAELLQAQVGVPSGPYEVLSGGGSVVISPGGVHTVSLRFTPPARGSAPGILELTSSDPARKSLRVRLTGRGR